VQIDEAEGGERSQETAEEPDEVGVVVLPEDPCGPRTDGLRQRPRQADTAIYRPRITSGARCTTRACPTGMTIISPSVMTSIAATKSG